HLDRSTVAVPDEPRGDALVIKDMTFQAGRHFRLLADLVTAPLVFVLRDPRLSISSRMRMVAADGGVPTYPQRESGWEVLFEQVQACRVEGRSYVLIDAGDFRAAPEAVFSRLFVALGMTFERSQLQWSPAPDVRLGNLDGAQHNWYRRVLNSRGLQPTTEKVPPLETFPVRGGFRAHVERSVQLYRLLRRDPRLLTPTCPTSVLANSRDRALTGAQR
ncbi:MAG: hypothetical protein ACRDTT_02635, partial [Pseudonocardiaceae bacterium]